MRCALFIFYLLSSICAFAQEEQTLSATDEARLVEMVGECDDLLARLKFGEAVPVHKSSKSLSEALYGEEDIRSLRTELRYMFTHLTGDSTRVVAEFKNLAERLYSSESTTVHDLALLQLLRGNFANHHTNSTDALALFQTARNLWESAPYASDVPLAVPPYYMGIISSNLGERYLERGQLNEAESDFKRAREIFEQYELPEFHAIASGNLAILYERQMKYQAAIDINLSVLPNLDSVSRDNRFLNTIYNNLGQAYARNGEYAEAKKYHERVLKNCANPDLNLDEAEFGLPARAYLGFIEEEQGNFNAALRLYQDALPEDNSMDRAERLHQIGLIHQKLKKLPEALGYYRQARDTYAFLYSEGNYRVAQIEETIAALYTAMSEYGTAHKHLDRAEGILNFDRTAKNFTQVASTSTLLSILVSRAANELLHYEADAKAGNLIRGLEEVLLADEMISALKARMIDRSSRATFREQWVSTYEIGLDLCYHLYQSTQEDRYLELGYYFAEKQHHELLLSGIRENQARFRANIPPEVQHQEQDLLARVIHAEKSIYEEESYGTQAYEHKLKEYKHQLAVVRREYEAFVRRVEKEYPDYHQLKHDPEVATLQQARTTLLPQQSQIVYAEGHRDIYAIVLAQDRQYFQKLDTRDQLDELVNTYFDELIGQARRSDPGKDQILGHLLYRKLFKSLEGQIGERVVIVPTGILGQLPFEALSRTGSGTPDYLLAHHTISYGYSSTLLWETSRSEKISYEKGGVLGFAPDYGTGQEIVAWLEDSENLRVSRNMDQNPLRYNKREVRLLTDAYGGKAYLKGKATEANFLQMAGRFPIIHLAVHGVADLQKGQYSHLVFAFRKKMEEEQHKLFARELYDRVIPAELVTLSACETGRGQLRRGDGIISISHAFRQSGARSVLNSLWLVNDEFTPELMSAFYERLAAGVPKDRALSEAKRSFLSDPHTKYNHPYYWATFVPVGNMESMNTYLHVGERKMFATNWMLYGGIALFALGFLLIGYFLKDYFQIKEADRT